MSKLILVDGNAIMHRAFHALPPLTTRIGEPINAVYGFISILLRIIEDLNPTHLAVCFDRPEPTFRKIEFKRYQAHRPEMDSGLSSQFAKMYQVLEAMQIPYYSQAGYEADDLIGTLARKVETDEVVIVTGDKDILQLVNGKIKVFMPTKGVEGKLYGHIEVNERLGVGPEEIVDYKALVGDPSDNYPGVPGIGPKTAVVLIKKYGSFKNIYQHLEELPQKTKEKLEKGRDLGDLSYRLASIVDSVDFVFDLGAMAGWQIDSQKVLDTFAEFSFKTLTRRVVEVGKKLAREKQMTLL